MTLDLDTRQTTPTPTPIHNIRHYIINIIEPISYIYISIYIYIIYITRTNLKTLRIIYTTCILILATHSTILHTQVTHKYSSTYTDTAHSTYNSSTSLRGTKLRAEGITAHSSSYILLHTTYTAHNPLCSAPAHAARSTPPSQHTTTVASVASSNIRTQ